VLPAASSAVTVKLNEVAGGRVGRCGETTNCDVGPGPPTGAARPMATPWFRLTPGLETKRKEPTGNRAAARVVETGRQGLVHPVLKTRGGSLIRRRDAGDGTVVDIGENEGEPPGCWVPVKFTEMSPAPTSADTVPLSVCGKPPPLVEVTETGTPETSTPAPTVKLVTSKFTLTKRVRRSGGNLRPRSPFVPSARRRPRRAAWRRPAPPATAAGKRNHARGVRAPKKTDF